MKYAAEYYHYGKVYLENGEPDNAINQFKSALETDPDNPNIHIGMGRALLAQKKIEEAREHLLKAMKLAPEFADAHFYMGMAYIETRNKESAINEFKEALNINPRYESAKVKLNELLGAKEKVAKKEEKDRRKRILDDEKTSRQANVHFHLANAFFQKNMLTEAHEELRQAIKLRPNFPDIRNRMGELHMKRHQYAKAEVEFEAALEVNPRYLSALLNLAECRHMNSEMLLNKAEADYQKALEVDPGSEKAKQGLEKIRAMRSVDYL